MATARIISYVGPACPRCDAPLTLDSITPGEDICPRCQGFFDATVFHPPQRIAAVLQVAQTGPESAGSCANHPRNVAVSNCGRCGLFICSLCELDLHGEKYCPACFDRMTQDGGIEQARTRFRDWRTLSFATALAGLLFSFILIGIPLGALSIYYAIRGFRDPLYSHDKALVLIVSILMSLGAIATGLVMFSGFVTGGWL
jgi:uncharacterized paraquat-inducible protein A